MVPSNEISARRLTGGEPRRSPMANYSSAIVRAVEWLGDRYLLAKPVKAAPSRVAVAPISARVKLDPGRRDVSPR
jgi:hypothetical protein